MADFTAKIKINRKNKTLYIMFLTNTERCIMDILNELSITKNEKFKLLEMYVPYFMEQGTLTGLEKIAFFVDHIELVEVMKRYASRRQKGGTVEGFFNRFNIKF